MPRIPRTTLFLTNFVQDALWFVFLLGLLSVYRAAFLIYFSQTLAPDTSAPDILLTLWYGLRISLKTAGALFLPCFVLGTLVQTAWPKWHADRVRWGWVGICLVGLSLLFQARIPYYHEFHHAFSPFVFNTFHDDVGAIVVTAVQQYHAVERVLAGLVCAALWLGLYAVWRKLGAAPVRWLAARRRPWIAVTVVALLLVPLAVFVRKGGSFTYNGSIYWKNAARMEQHLLNEAILDDVQALYRASRIYKKLAKSSSSLTASEVTAALARLQQKPAYTAPTLLPFLQRRAPGPKIEKPRHIFVIVGETYMMWPLLDKYAFIPMARGMRRLAARPDAVLAEHFLPASNGTMFGLTSVFLGVPEVNLVTASRPTAQQPYETSLALQLAAQGYKTQFFYGGFPSWENIGPFMQNQQIGQAFYAADFGVSGGVWGVPDREFLQGVAQRITPQPSFNLILTSSNHPPYKVDQSREPDLPTVADFKKQLPADTADPELTAQRAWHFAYADKYLAQFVEQMLEQYPDSLFVITGDHADRWTLQSSPSLYERLAVPLLVVGRGIKKDMLSQNAAGNHQDIAATVLELILPRGTSYYAFGKSIFNGQHLGVGAYYWITPQAIGEHNTDRAELLPGAVQLPSPEELQQIKRTVQDEQAVAAWRILHGTALDD